MKKILLVMLALMLCVALIACDGEEQPSESSQIKHTLTINFHANGGEGEMSSITADGGSTVTLPTCTFTKENYAFLGWSIGNSGLVNFNDCAGVLASSDKTEEINLYAVWGERKTTIVFMNNGGVGVMDPITIPEGETIVLPECRITRDGYSFFGWSTDMHAIIGEVGPNITAEEGAHSITLYAVWKMNGTRITFDANGGVGNMGTIAVTALKEAPLPTCEFTREGYMFVGWATEKTGALTYTDGATYTASSQNQQITLYAVWQKLEPKSAITIIFDASFGMGQAYGGSTYFETAKQRLFSYLNDDRLSGKIVSVIVYDQDSSLVLNPVEKPFENDTTDSLKYQLELANMADSMDEWFYGDVMDKGEGGVNNRVDALGNPVKAYGSNLSIAIGRAGSTISFLATTEKDIVLITGTMPFDKGSGYEGAVARMKNEGVCFSTIMIGEANTELETELKSLSEKGGGKFIYKQMLEADDIFEACKPVENKE